MLSFEQARELVIQHTAQGRRVHFPVRKSVWDALGYALAEEIRTDREYPPFDRSTRDGYAVRAIEAKSGAAVRCAGEIKAGDTVSAGLVPGTCIQIMTGAAVPSGADAVVMIEFTKRAGEMVRFERDTNPHQNIVPRGSEARAGDVALHAGVRLGFAELALAAQVGAAEGLPARSSR